MLRLSRCMPILAALALAGPATSSVLAQEQECGEYGTSVTFAKSPADAAKLALQQEKLVFVLHVSGNFEVSDYT